MKLLRYGEAGAEKPGLLDPEGKIRDLSGEVPDIGGDVLSEDGLSRLARLDWRSLPVVDDKARLGPCVARPLNFIGIADSYAATAVASGVAVPTEPVMFLKSLSAFSGPNDPVILPRGSEKADWEVELALVIGKRGRYITETDALSHVAGYTIVNDVSERSFQLERGGTWDKGKGCDTFAPTGPWLVTRDEIPDPNNLGIWLELDGRRVQDGSTSMMMFKVTQLVSYCSQFFTLHPGDIISTGTPPGAGIGQKPPFYLLAGQTMRLGVDGLGEQMQTVVAAA